MKGKWNTIAWIFLVFGIALLLNATSKAGFFPSGHGAGRVPEIIQGVAFVIGGTLYLIYARRKARTAAR